MAAEIRVGLTVEVDLLVAAVVAGGVRGGAGLSVIALFDGAPVTETEGGSRFRFPRALRSPPNNRSRRRFASPSLMSQRAVDYADARRAGAAGDR